MTSRFNLIIFISLLLSLGYSCTPDDDLPPPDPCLTAPAPDPTFSMYRSLERTVLGEEVEVRLEVRDTVYFGAINFEAAGGYDDYQWTIGSDQRVFDEREFWLHFPVYIADGLEVSLTVAEDFAECSERELETASSTQRFDFIHIPYDEPHLYEATFVGNNKKETDQPPFEINLAKDPDGRLHLRDFPRGAKNDDFFNDIGIRPDYKQFIFLSNNSSCCFYARGIGTISDDRQTLRIDYRYRNEAGDGWIEDVWTGTRK